MKNNPIIGIIGRSVEEDNNSIIKVNENYRLAVVNSGGVPFIIVPTNYFEYGKNLPNKLSTLTVEEKENLFEILKMCDGIILTGGTHWYQFDEIICKYALDNNIPILGICLGMQILGNIDNFRSDLSSDKTVKNNTYINHFQVDVPYVHDCIITEGILHNIFKINRLRVNSRHNYHILPKDYFKIEAYSEDDLIEAISIPGHNFAVGVQWHPESMLEYDHNMKKLFDVFIGYAKKEKQKK